jgi:DNA-binding transcriptional regulator GbsR (MarR family)
MNLSPAFSRFVLHWGEMGARWGMNRTLSQLHALLFLAERPMHAEEIADTLGVARSNVSTSLKELQSWGLVSITHLMGERRDHYVALQDVYEIFRLIVEGRKRREIDPTLSMLRDCVLQADEATPAAVLKKVEDVLGFVEALNEWYDEMKKLKPGSWLQLMKMGAKVHTLLKKTG